MHRIFLFFGQLRANEFYRKKVKVNFDCLKILVNFLLMHLYAWPAQLLVLDWELVCMYHFVLHIWKRRIFSFNNSLLTKTGIQYLDSLRASSPGRSVDGAGKGRIALNYVSGIWILICIETVDAKCWFAEMTLAMTSLPLTRVFRSVFFVFFFFFYISTRFRFALIGGNWTAQLTGSHRGIGGGIQLRQTYLQALLVFPAPPPKRPGEPARRLVPGIRKRRRGIQNLRDQDCLGFPHTGW